MKISIITSCFNRVTTIGKAIESVLSQDYNDIEYIIVDGASDDGSLEVINKYRDKVSVVISEPDNGMYEAINKGIQAATGDFIGLMHSDDVFYSPNVISKIVSKLEDDSIDIVYGNGVFVGNLNSNKIIRKWISGKYKKSKIRNGWLPLHPTVYIRRKCFDEMGLYDESFQIAADSDLLLRYFYEANFKISYINDYIVKMQMGGLSTDKSKIKIKWSEDLRLYRLHGFNPYWSLFFKIISKTTQFVQAKF